MDFRQLAEISLIFSKLPRSSQVFWLELEQEILSKSSDFKGHKDQVLQVALGIGRAQKSAEAKNETFWKVYGMHLNDFSQEMSFHEFIAILDVLDYSNGEILFT